MPEPDQLIELSREDPAWLDLIAAAPVATVFHLPAWARVIADTYGFRTAVLALQASDGHLVAGLPVAYVRRGIGRAAVSLPFTDRCAPLARGDANLARLAAGLSGWSTRRGAAVEVRGAVPLAAGWANAVVGVEHVLDLKDGAEALRKRFSETHRRRLRQAERSGLRVRLGRTADDVAAFYRLHVLTRRRQGVPVQSRRFFGGIWHHLIAPGYGVVVLTETSAAEAVAGALVLAWNGMAIVKFQASDATSWELRPNHLCYWAAIRWSSEFGCRHFSFGRTEWRHSGLRQWKAGWGSDAVPLSYSVTGGAGLSVDGHGRLDAVLSHVIRRSPTLVCRALGSLLYRYAA